MPGADPLNRAANWLTVAIEPAGQNRRVVVEEDAVSEQVVGPTGDVVARHRHHLVCCRGLRSLSCHRAAAPLAERLGRRELDRVDREMIGGRARAGLLVGLDVDADLRADPAPVRLVDVELVLAAPGALDGRLDAGEEGRLLVCLPLVGPDESGAPGAGGRHAREQVRHRRIGGQAGAGAGQGVLEVDPASHPDRQLLGCRVVRRLEAAGRARPGGHSCARGDVLRAERGVRLERLGGREIGAGGGGRRNTGCRRHARVGRSGGWGAPVGLAGETAAPRGCDPARELARVRVTQALLGSQEHRREPARLVLWSRRLLALALRSGRRVLDIVAHPGMVDPKRRYTRPSRASLPERAGRELPLR